MADGISELISELRIESKSDPLRYIAEEPAESVASDTARMAAAGAALTFAIYHSSKDEVLAMPDRVLRAYARACSVYRVTDR